MKIIYMMIIMIISFSVYANEGCELPKLETKNILEKKTDEGCKVGNTTDDLVTCLLNAKNKEEEAACHSKKKDNTKLIIPEPTKKTSK